jgi:hypothetical protein
MSETLPRLFLRNHHHIDHLDKIAPRFLRSDYYSLPSNSTSKARICIINSAAVLRSCKPSAICLICSIRATSSARPRGHPQPHGSLLVAVMQIGGTSSCQKATQVAPGQNIRKGNHAGTTPIAGQRRPFAEAVAAMERRKLRYQSSMAGSCYWHRRTSAAEMTGNQSSPSDFLRRYDFRFDEIPSVL